MEEGCKKPKAYKRNVLEEKACEFLKLIKQNNYKMINQLNHTPAWILLLSLFLNSKLHRQLLIKVLNQAHIYHDISIEKLNGIIVNIIVDNYLNFINDEILYKGMDHNKSLHISVKYNNSESF